MDDLQLNNNFNENSSISIERLITEGNVDDFVENQIDNSIIEEINFKDRAKLCYVCDDSRIDFFFDCGNGVCQECLIEHIKAQLSKYKVKLLSDKIKFTCAGSCKCPTSSGSMENIMNKETREIYDEVLLKMYLTKSSDVISCPQSSCQNYFFIQKFFSSTLNIFFNFSANRFSKCFECPECKYTWSDNESIFRDPNNIIKKLSLSNIKSVIRKYITTKYCNNCSAPIEKAEGCKHIECNRCEYSFCWRCTEDWTIHKELSCMGMFTNEYEESFRPEFIFPLLNILIILSVLKFAFSFIIVFYLLWFLIKILVFFSFLVFDAFLIYGALLCLIKYKQKLKSALIIGIMVICEWILYKYELHIFSDKIYFYLQIISLPIFTMATLLTKSIR